MVGSSAAHLRKVDFHAISSAAERLPILQCSRHVSKGIVSCHSLRCDLQQRGHRMLRREVGIQLRKTVCRCALVDHGLSRGCCGREHLEPKTVCRCWSEQNFALIVGAADSHRNTEKDLGPMVCDVVSRAVLQVFMECNA